MPVNWKESYKATLVETDPTKLLALIHETEIAITARSECIPPAGEHELQQLRDAICGLRVLKRETMRGQLAASL